MFEKIWRDNLKEIQENKIRFVAVCICFIVVFFLFLTDDNDGDKIILNDTPAPVETSENVDANAKVIAVQNSTNSNVNGNVKIVLGANSDDLFVRDPFKIPPKEKVEPPPIAFEPSLVVQVPAPPAEKFILRGVAIIANNKSALVQKFSGDKNSADENLILEIGDSLNGKKIVEISTDSLILEDGETLFLDVQTP